LHNLLLLLNFSNFILKKRKELKEKGTTSDSDLIVEQLPILVALEDVGVGVGPGEDGVHAAVDAQLVVGRLGRRRAPRRSPRRARCRPRRAPRRPRRAPRRRRRLRRRRRRRRRTPLAVQRLRPHVFFRIFH